MRQRSSFADLLGESTRCLDREQSLVLRFSMAQCPRAHSRYEGVGVGLFLTGRSSTVFLTVCARLAV